MRKARRRAFAQKPRVRDNCAGIQTSWPRDGGWVRFVRLWPAAAATVEARVAVDCRTVLPPAAQTAESKGAAAAQAAAAQVAESVAAAVQTAAAPAAAAEKDHCVPLGAAGQVGQLWERAAVRAVHWVPPLCLE